MDKEMTLPERMRAMAAQVATNHIAGATTRRLIELDMIEAAGLIDQLRQQLAAAEARIVVLHGGNVMLQGERERLNAERDLAVKSLKVAGWQVVDDVACQRRLFTIHHEAEMYAATLPAPRIETLWSGYERTATNAAIAAGGEGDRDARG